jgi:hypothetical protein
MEMNLTKLVPSIKEIEESYISFIIKNPMEVYQISESYIYDHTSKIICKAIKEICDKKLTIDLNVIHQFCLKEDSNITLDVIKSINNIPIINIDYTIQQIKDSYSKHQIVNKIEEMFVNATSKNDFDYKKLMNIIQDMFSHAYHIESIPLQGFDTLIKDHQEIMNDRREGKKIKSLGFRSIDKKLTKPGAPEEMTLLIGMKGSLKSVMCKCIESHLISMGICVLSINLEMSKESCLDRLMCIKYGFELNDLIKKDKGRTLERTITDRHKDLEEIKNYMFCSDADINLSKLDGLIYQAKNIFRSKGILPEDEYIFITIDLLDMIEEFGDAESPYKIKKAINVMHRICRKHKCHFLLLHQANENKIRSGKMFKKPEDLDYYKIGLEDIEGGASLAARSRVVMTITRPLQMKKRFFPEEMERWDLETDFVNINIVKQNDGKEGYIRFVLGEYLRLHPFLELEEKEEVEEDA